MSWQLVAHRSELAKPGDYVLLSAGRDQLLAYNHEGEIVITDNVCPHRGSRIMSGTCGNAPMTCPYHGWKAEAILAKSHPHLQAWVGDWLFEGDGSTKIEWDLGQLRPGLETISRNISSRHSFDMLPMPCDWRVAVENTLEDYHVQTVHPDTFGKLGLDSGLITRSGKNSTAHYNLTDAHTIKGLTALSKYFGPEVIPSSYFHYFLSPFTSISSVGGFSFSVQHYMPNGGFTMLHSRLYRAKTNPNAPDITWFYNEAEQFNRMVFAQDAAACARVVGLGTVLTQNEERVRWFRESHS